MNVIIGNRQQGKTTLLIKMSAAGEGIIIAATRKSAEYIKHQAKLMNVEIPEPISMYELLIQNRGRRDGPYLLDELGSALASLNIKTATLDSSNVKYM